MVRIKEPTENTAVSWTDTQCRAGILICWQQTFVCPGVNPGVKAIENTHQERGQHKLVPV